MPSVEESAEVPFEPAEKVLDDQAPLVEYTRAQPANPARTTMEIPVMRNRPFGDQLGGGGETPFFLDSGSSGGGGTPFDDDDGQPGVPTGLPAVLGRLDEVALRDDPSESSVPAPMSGVVAMGEGRAELEARLADAEAKLARAKGVIPVVMGMGLVVGLIGGAALAMTLG